MLRRWCIPLAALALSAGSALAATAASAATTASAPTTSAAIAHAVRSGIKPGGPIGRNLIKPDARGGPVRAQAESTSWAGYAAVGGTYTSVSANWAEPAGTCSGSAQQYASFWVGLDGYSSDSVEQIGTDSDCDAGTPVYYGWYEMYPAEPVYFSNAVEPGDSMSASVVFSGSDTYTLTLTDNTEGWTQTETQNESGLARSSAEVITEAPSGESGTLPITDFGTVTFTGCMVDGAALGDSDPVEISSPGLSVGPLTDGGEDFTVTEDSTST